MLTINVTEEDIENGLQYSERNNPISLAIMRENNLIGQAMVNDKRIICSGERSTVLHYLHSTPEIGTFLRLFNSSKKVTPRIFEVK